MQIWRLRSVSLLARALLLAAVALPAGAQSPAAHREVVYARVGDRVVTVGDIEDSLAATPRDADAPLSRDALVERTARRLLDEALLAREAERQGLGARHAVRHAHQVALVQELVQQELDEPHGRDAVSEAEMRAYYDAHRDDFGDQELESVRGDLRGTTWRARRERMLDAWVARLSEGRVTVDEALLATVRPPGEEPRGRARWQLLQCPHCARALEEKP